MYKNLPIKTRILGLLFGASVFTVGNTYAASFDFVALAALGERGALSETFTSDGLSVTASAHLLGNSSVSYYMYLDDLNIEGNPAGLGVCKQLSGDDCDPGSDDNITENEVLLLTFSQPVQIQAISFSNGVHLDNYLGSFGVAIDDPSPTFLDFTQYPNTAVFAGLLTGTVFAFFSDASISGIEEVERQLYLSALTAIPVPEPSSMLLLSAGFLPLIRRRIRNRS